MDIHIAAGGDCKDVTQGAIVNGTFIADDLYFGGWSLGTEPNTLTTPSNYLRGRTMADSPGGSRSRSAAWTLLGRSINALHHRN
jgi:hypothetical protein